MSIQGLTSSNFFSGVTRVRSGVSAAPAEASPGATGGASMSKAGQFLATLQSVAQRDPAQAKQMLTDLAAQFCGEAKSGGSPHKAALADALQKAADTQDLSGLLKQVEGASTAWAKGAGAYQQTMAVTRASR